MADPRRVLLIAPLKRPIYPQTTVSRLRIIIELANGLMKRGWQVGILGTGDSHLPGVTFHSGVEKALVSLPTVENPFYQHTAAITRQMQVLQEIQSSYDLIHNHMYPEFFPLLLSPYLQRPMVTTIHAQMTASFRDVLVHAGGTHIVAISEQAKKDMQRTDVSVVCNGVDTTLYRPLDHADRSYLLFVGRMSRARGSDGHFLDPKGVCDAISVAERLQKPLKIVGNVEDRSFYDTLIKPHLSDKISFVGDVQEEQMLTREQVISLYQHAQALLNPIRWEEPFGLVMIESMACGTPVIAYRRGAVGEIVIDGKTGYVVPPEVGVDGLCHAVQTLDTLQIEAVDMMTHACRDRVCASFSVDHMVEGYLSLYQQLLSSP